MDARCSALGAWDTRRDSVERHAAQDPSWGRSRSEVAGVPALPRVDRALRATRQGAGAVRSLLAVCHRLGYQEIVDHDVLTDPDPSSPLVRIRGLVGVAGSWWC